MLMSGAAQVYTKTFSRTLNEPDLAGLLSENAVLNQEKQQLQATIANPHSSPC